MSALNLLPFYCSNPFWTTACLGLVAQNKHTPRFGYRRALWLGTAAILLLSKGVGAQTTQAPPAYFEVTQSYDSLRAGLNGIVLEYCAGTAYGQFALCELQGPPPNFLPAIIKTSADSH